MILENNNEHYVLKLPELNTEENDFLSKLFYDIGENLFKVAFMRLHDEHFAEDVVQDTFLAAVVNIKKLKNSPNPQGWLMNALKFKIKDAQKVKHKYTLLEPDIISILTNGTSVSNENDFDLREILNKNEYEILRLIYGSGYKTHEVAEKYGIKVEACKKRIQTAKRKLSQELLLSFIIILFFTILLSLNQSLTHIYV